MPHGIGAPSGGHSSTGPQEQSRSDPAPASRRIRVLIVDSAIAFGGTLVVARNLLKHLDTKLIDASLVSACLDGFVSRGFAGDAEVRFLAPRVDYVTRQNWKRAIRRLVRWAPVRRSLELLLMAIEFLANTSYLFRLVHLYRKLSVDVVHANNYTMEPLWAARLLSIPIVYHLHGFLYSPIDGSGRRNFRHVSAFVSISRAVRESAIRAGIDQARIHDIPNFVGCIPEASPPAMPTVPAIGIFGRVTRWKGQKEFLRAAMHVLPHFPGLRVYIVGDASDGDPRYFDECRELARSSPFEHQIQFTGRVTDVAAYYRKCTVVVHASIEPEPFGMVLIEAMAQARPVVASRLGAAPEIIEDGVDGFLTDPHDPQAMARRISELLNYPALAKRMGLQGLRKVWSQYDAHAAAKRFQQLYVDVARSTASADTRSTT
jgi:glycosyltransferase involved in cell wall biosynthesis